MTDHTHDNDKFDLDPPHLDQLSTEHVLAIRNDAFYAKDLARALRADNELETRLEVADYREGRRRTCRACGGWADHIHDPLSDEPMTVQRWGFNFNRADVDATAQIAWQVFALASAAPRWAWDALPDGAHRITVSVDGGYFRVIVPADDPDGRPGTPYINGTRTGPVGGVQPPVIYASPRAAAAITDARRYLTPPA